MTRTGSPSSCARRTAAAGSSTSSTTAKCRRACSASAAAGSERAFDDDVATNRSPSDARRPEHLVDVLVAQDRGADRVVGAVEASPQPRDAVRVVGAVAHLAGPSLEPPGERGVDCCVDAMADERLRGLAGAAEHDVARQARAA